MYGLRCGHAKASLMAGGPCTP